jgi:hypothetical protein
LPALARRLKRDHEAAPILPARVWQRSVPRGTVLLPHHNHISPTQRKGPEGRAGAQRPPPSQPQPPSAGRLVPPPAVASPSRRSRCSQDRQTLRPASGRRAAARVRRGRRLAGRSEAGVSPCVDTFLVSSCFPECQDQSKSINSRCEGGWALAEADAEGVDEHLRHPRPRVRPAVRPRLVSARNGETSSARDRQTRRTKRRTCAMIYSPQGVHGWSGVRTSPLAWTSRRPPPQETVRVSSPVL